MAGSSDPSSDPNQSLVRFTSLLKCDLKSCGETATVAGDHYTHWMPDGSDDGFGAWIAERLRQGCLPHEIGVFVRSENELKRARAAVKAAGAASAELSDKAEAEPGRVAISTMHLAKGLEFRSVAVMACDDEVIPLQDRIERVADDADLEEVYNTERHLLYVACTRARDHLLVSDVNPASEFLEDFGRGG